MMPDFRSDLKLHAVLVAVSSVSSALDLGLILSAKRSQSWQSLMSGRKIGCEHLVHLVAGLTRLLLCATLL